MEKYFSTNASFQVVETDFLASANHSLYFCRDSCRGESFFCLAETYSLTNPSFQLLEKDFSAEVFFLLAETVTAMSGRQNLFFLMVTHFLASRNHFLSLPLYFQPIFQSKRIVWFFIQNFLSC